MRNRFCIAVALLLAALGSARAAITVDSVVAEALANNPEVAAAEMKWRAAQAAVVPRGWLPDPKLSFSADQIPDGDSPFDAAGMRMLQLSQAVPFPAKLIIRADMARKAALIAEAGYDRTRLSVVNSARAAYYDYYLVSRTLEIKQEERVDAPLDSPAEPAMPELTLSSGELRQLTLKNQPELQSALYRVEKSSADLALAAWDYAPDLMLGAMREQMGESKMTMYGAMLGINVPLWFWTKNSGISAKKAEKRSAEAMLQATQNRVLAGLATDAAMVQTASRRVKLFETTILPLAEQALTSASMGYETGAVDFLTLMDASRKLIEARLGYVTTQVELGKGMAMLEMRVGTDLTKGTK
jgi:cobalt-zinc-cadmium efflux system outer membrane protein